MLNWTFDDDDVGDVQVAYNVTVWDNTKSTILWFNNLTSAASSDIYNSTGTAIADLTDGSDYWLSVAVFDGTVWSTFNETLFHMNAVPPIPALQSPLDTSAVAPGTQVLTWNPVSDVETDIITYYWYVSTNAIFSPILDSNMTTSMSASIITIMNNDYYWRVKAYDGYEFSSNSTTWTFSTSSSPPTLTWTGETDYGSDGLHPESGDTAAQFVFRVNYADNDNHAPQSGHPRVVILKDGVEVSNESMNAVDANDSDYTDGKLYTITLQLTEVSDSYEYYFYTLDALGDTASTSPKDAPDVTQSPDEGSPWWWILIILVVMVIVIILLLLYFYWRKKKREAIEVPPPSPPPLPPPPPPPTQPP
ncbi:MAG: hypothetical protein KAI64_05420, partial [Thermoplasmata archaeon]|nr:hypothetical protein [Thermoplasmata archaeon]